MHKFYSQTAFSHPQKMYMKNRHFCFIWNGGVFFYLSLKFISHCQRAASNVYTTM